MPGLILAAINPDNTPHGYNWTFAFPMILFAVIALVLYALFSRPHQRVPGRPIIVTPGSRASAVAARGSGSGAEAGTEAGSSAGGAAGAAADGPADNAGTQSDGDSSEARE